MTTAIGSGFIAIGALLALASVIFAPDEIVGELFLPDHLRQVRNGNVATLCAAAAGFAGAVLVLLGSEWIYAFVAAAGVALVYYAFLVLLTWRDHRSILVQLLRERDTDKNDSGDPGRVTTITAARLGILSEFGLVGLFLGPAHDPTSLALADQAERTARTRARLMWALRFPYGVQRDAPPVRLTRWLRTFFG